MSQTEIDNKHNSLFMFTATVTMLAIMVWNTLRFYDLIAGKESALRFLSTIIIQIILFIVFIYLLNHLWQKIKHKISNWLTSVIAGLIMSIPVIVVNQIIMILVMNIKWRFII